MKKKLLFSFLPLCLVSLSIGAFASYFFAHAMLTRQVFAHIRAVGAVEKNRIESFVDNSLMRLSLIATRGHLRTAVYRLMQSGSEIDRRRLNQILEEIAEAMPKANEVSVLHLNGRVMASSDPSLIGKEHPNRSPLLAAQFDNRFDIYFPQNSDRPVGFLYGPIHREGRLIALIAAQADMARFVDWLADNPAVGETVEIQLARWDEQGHALFLTPDTAGSRRAMRRAAPVNPDSARKLLSGRRFLADVVDSKNEPVIATTYYLPKMDWNLIVKMDREEALSPVTKLRNLFLILFLILSASVIVIANLLSRSLVRPILDLRRVAERVRDGDLSPRARVENRDEVGALAQALNQMTETLLQAKSHLERKVDERTRELGRSEAQLRNSIKFLDSIIENIPNMIFVKDARSLRFIRFNRAGEELLGQSRDALIGKTDYDFFPKNEADFFTAKDRQVLQSGKTFTIDEETIHAHQGIRILRTRKIPVMDEHERPIFLLGISEDITDKKRAEQDQLDLARARAEKEQLELFAYVAAHDLQEPLHKIVSFGDLLREQVPADTKGVDYLERMQSAARRMSRLIDDILRFSRLTTKDEALEPVDLSALIRDVATDLEFRIEQSGARLDVGDLPTILASRVQIREVFQNLIVNAIKFRKKDEPPVIIIRSTTRGTEELVITVIDNGIGFEEKFQERIFRPFERLHGRKDYDGSGIGLAICQKMIARHGGRIFAHSRPGEGATFTIILPGHALKESHVNATS